MSVFEFNGKGVRFEERDGTVWISLTDIATASGKKVNNWNRLRSTIDFLTELESVMGNPVMETRQGGQPSLRGVWAIEEVAIKFAAWCSPSFEIWMIMQVKKAVKSSWIKF